MDEVRDKMIGYAGMIKNADPSALVAGPEEWGWSGYFFSGYDQQYGGVHGWSQLPDRQNHGGADYLPWLLDSIRQSSATAGRRLLDLFTVHYYPQSGEFSDDVSAAMQQMRNRSTRSLWNPAYQLVIESPPSPMPALTLSPFPARSPIRTVCPRRLSTQFVTSEPCPNEPTSAVMSPKS